MQDNNFHSTQDSNNTNQQRSLWENAVVYQIYPRSFAEVRPDGVEHRGEGSLLGIASKLDYLVDLGVDVIWLSPFYPSPMKDSGYDVSDYCNVDSRYGSLEDFDYMASQAHERGIRLMVDFVPNHTSDQHPWFLESRSSKDNPKSDWYIWRDAKPDGSPPNNWASVFSLPQLEKRHRGELELEEDEVTPPVSAWQWDESRQQYYLHTFAVEQPDLDWSNPEVRQAMTDAMRFWLNKGVDGFRIDAVNHTGKNMSLQDDDPNPWYREGIDNPYDQLLHTHSANYPSTFYGYLKSMTDVLLEEAYAWRDTYIVFETYVPQKMIDKINAIAPHKAGAFNFTRIHLDWNAGAQKRAIDEYFKHLKKDVIANHVNGNHDNPRVASRIGDRQARAAALINATLPGQMYIYNGEEAGFHDVYVPLDLRDDNLGLRDAERTPMVWDATAKNGGFSDADKTWLPIGPDYQEHSIAIEMARPHSSLWLYKKLLAIKRHSEILQKGSYKALCTSDPDVIAYARHYNGKYVIVAINFAGSGITYEINKPPLKTGKIVLSTHRLIDQDEPVLEFSHKQYLSPYEAVIFESI